MLCVPFKCKNVSSENTGVYEQLNRNDIGSNLNGMLGNQHSEIYKY